jgi:squalene synthase HpnC
LSDLTELQTADAYCRYLTRRHYENFFVVSLFLPRAVRTHLTRIYGFCRTTDDYGDESGAGTQRNHGLERLQDWGAQVRAAFAGHAPIHPVLIALAPTAEQCRIPEDLFLDLIQANIQDQTTDRYAHWEELRRYCMLSAAPVGRMVLRVFGIADPVADALSDDVCIGLQLANHAQDVKRDAARGRAYVLQEVVERAGMREAVRDLCDRAEKLLDSGRMLENMVPFNLRAQLALYRLGGLEVVRSIRMMGYRTDEWRPSVSTATKLRLMPVALLQSMTRWEHATPQRAA